MQVFAHQELRRPNFLRSMCGSAFTLVEILAACSIIAVLAALFFPALAKARSSAQSSVCAANLRKIGIAFSLYAADHNNAYPEPWWNAEYSTTPPGWYSVLLGKSQLGSPSDIGTLGPDYLGDYRALICPSASEGSALLFWPPQDYPYYLGYGMVNLALWWPSLHYTGSPDSSKYFWPWKLKTRSAWPLVMDADWPVISNLEDPIPSAPPASRFAARHNGFANVLMSDGHVEKVKSGDNKWRQEILNNGDYYEP